MDEEGYIVVTPGTTKTNKSGILPQAIALTRHLDKQLLPLVLDVCQR